MVAQIASFTQLGKEYDVEIKNGKAINCACLDHQYRNRTCKHMSNANAQVQMEIERAATFLALKAQYGRNFREEREQETAASYMRMFYAEY